MDRISSENISFTLEEELKRLVLSLKERHDPDVMILAGSLAEGRWVRGLSDIDILIITKRIQEPEHINRFELRSINGIDVNIAIYTREEVNMGIKSLNFFLISAINSGIALYGEKEFEEMKALLREEAEKLKLVRREGGWDFTINEEIE